MKSRIDRINAMERKALRQATKAGRRFAKTQKRLKNAEKHLNGRLEDATGKERQRLVLKIAKLKKLQQIS